MVPMLNIGTNREKKTAQPRAPRSGKIAVGTKMLYRAMVEQSNGTWVDPGGPMDRTGELVSHGAKYFTIRNSDGRDDWALVPDGARVAEQETVKGNEAIPKKEVSKAKT